MECFRCGASLSPEWCACPQCGERVAPPAVDANNEGDLFLRFFAMLIDGVVIGAISMVAGWFIPGTSALALPMQGELGKYLSESPLFLIVLLVYYGLMEGSQRMATLGKQVFGLKTADANGYRLTYQAALVRAFGRILSSACGIGYFIAIFTDRNRALHDFLADSVVVEA